MTAAAAAAHARMLREEEERLATYSKDDAQFEFKILRSATGAFRNPETLQKACNEEAAAGWILVEKFDNSRLRFKRPLSARGHRPTGIDPYRTNYGISSGLLALLILIPTLFIPLLFMTIMIVTSSRHPQPKLIQEWERTSPPARPAVDPFAIPPNK